MSLIRKERISLSDYFRANNTLYLRGNHAQKIATMIRVQEPVVIPFRTKSAVTGERKNLTSDFQITACKVQKLKDVDFKANILGGRKISNWGNNAPFDPNEDITVITLNTESVSLELDQI